MDIDHGFYNIKYEEEQYENLQFLRIDKICEVSYVTFKNVLQEDIMTFETKKIRGVQKSNTFTDFAVDTLNMVAD